MTLTGLREDNQHVLLWQARGRTALVVAGTRLTLTAGSALWIPARTEHQLVTAPNSALLPLFFDSRRYARGAVTATVLPVDAECETLLLALIGSQYSRLRPPAELEEMVLGIVQAHLATPAGSAMPRSDTALRVARRVVLNPADRRTLSAWAAEVHVSARTLERAFVAETGMSWHRWRLHHRMYRAAQLLETTTLPVTEIATNVGFGTPSAFSRAFRKHHGRTPLDHRNQKQAVDKGGCRPA